MKYSVLALLALLPLSAAHADPLLELKKGDHICIIGNTLAERMQHDGWLETLIHARFPRHELVFRNLGFSGDELTQRIRSQSFGTPDQWLAGSAPVPEPTRLTTRIGVRENRFETTNTRADVVFAFFGYNESWAGEAGLPKFKKDLDDFIKHTLGQKYNGKSAPKLVIFSPTPFEENSNRNLPDGKLINDRLQLYSAAMAEIAKANQVPFVNLCGPELGLLFNRAPAQQPKLTQLKLTINGVHLNEAGNRLVAETIDRELFGKPAEELPAYLEKLRQSVLDKNFYWFNRYRVMDGFNVYGGRAFERYADKQSNYEDQQRELEIFDVKTANRDKHIWSVAQGGDSPIDDSNCPPLIPVKSNRPEFLPENGHKFLSGEEAITKLKIHSAMEVTLFASEKEWPELAKPVQMQFDARGRLWVAVWPSYPRWKPSEERNDKILIFEDTKGTGKADKVTVFADHLNCPTGFDFWNGGVIVAQAPELLFLKDSKGGDKADTRIRLISGLDSADSHHTSNSFVFDGGGGLYFQEGTFHHTQVEDPYGPSKRCANGGVFRYEPRTQKFDVYVSTGFANPHGHVFDRWGQDIVVDGTGANPYHAALFSGHVDFPNKHPKPPQVYQQRTRPCPGMEYLSSKHFPPEMQGNLLVADVISFRGILNYKIVDKDSSFAGIEEEPILQSTDVNFRPSDLKIGPDGAIWFLDWCNPIIGHLQHAIREPARDRTHGRIYRITYKGRELSKSPMIAGQPLDKLLDLLKETEDRVRYRVRAELTARKTEEVIPALAKWTQALDETDKDYEHHLLEALWLYQSHNAVRRALLLRELESSDFRVRAAATRVLCYWRDQLDRSDRLSVYVDPDRLRVYNVKLEQVVDAINRTVKPTPPAKSEVKGGSLVITLEVSEKNIAALRKLGDLEIVPEKSIFLRDLAHVEGGASEALELLKKQAADAHPRVRLEAIRAASFFNVPEAVEVVAVASDFASDVYIDFVRNETMKQIEPIYKAALARGDKINFTTAAGARYQLRNVKVEDLLKMVRTKAVCLELLYRPGVSDENRRAALADVAKLDKKSELKVLLDAVARIDDAVAGRGELVGRDEGIVFDLIRLLQGRSKEDLAAVRGELEKLAATAKKPLIRQVGYVALINVDGSPDRAWDLAVKSVSSLRDLLSTMPLIPDLTVRAKLYPKVEMLLGGLPPELEAQVGNSKGTAGRFVRIDLKGRKTLSLAEVEVYSNGVNIARKGKATQKNTDFGGTADRAIDGNRSNIFGMGSITHTQENTPDPWWEVDLGDEYPIDKIMVFNRGDGAMGNRLNNFNLRVLDKQRREVFVRENNSAPPRFAEFELSGSGPRIMIQRAAMDALTTVRGEEPKTFKTLSKLILDDSDRFAAIRSIQRLGRSYWPKEDAPALVKVVLAAIKKIPTAQRTGADALDALEFADALSTLLPPDEGKMLRLELGELGVRVIRLNTLPERMSYDKEVLVVKAGKPVEFLFENTDLMPHNFVITQAGAMEEVGKLAEAQATDPSAAERHFVPKSAKILLSSTLLQPRDLQKLSFTAPAKPGVYPYVCTYPGHWMRMHGALYVVEDLEAYQASPEAYLTKNPVEIKDPLLKDRRPRTEWKFDDLASAVAEMKSGRSFSNGKQMFAIGTCIACHKLEGVGNEFGPDLTKFDPKWKPLDILKEMVDPSARINEKFQTWIIETDAGKKFTGLILEETNDMVKLIENPLAKTAPVVIKKSSIESRKKSDISTMPKGLLDKMTRDEILDLIAYVYSRTSKEHEFFKGEHHH